MPENQEVVEVDDEVDEREGEAAADAERSISERYYGTSSMSPIQADFASEREREICDECLNISAVNSEGDPSRVVEIK